jgi:uncharacterized protein (TIGR02147 family)
MAVSSSRINIFTYLDYRKFLKDWYTHAKETKRGFSFRAFSKKAGFSSPNFLKLVMDGQRNLTTESVLGIIKGLDLNKQETDFFKKLVFFTQAQTHEEKTQLYTQLVRSQKLNELKPLAKERLEYYSTWYHPVVREMIVSPQCDGTAQWVAAHCKPGLKIEAVEKSLILLEKLGMIKKGKAGRWEQAEPLVTSGAEVESLILMNYHQSVLDLVKYQLPRLEASQRDVSTLTLGVEKGKLSLLKRKVQEFRRELLKFVADDQAEDVVLLAMQLLPVTKG